MQLEALFYRKLVLKGALLLLVGEELDLVKFLNQILLQLHLGIAHDLANGKLERAQAADVGDVDM